MENKTLLSLIVPKELCEYFDLTEVQEKGEQLFLYLSEKNILPDGYKPEEYESKGFFNEQTVQDFPLRGKEVYLQIQRRRWRHKTTGAEIHRDWTSVSSGSKLTTELAAFLKEAHRRSNR